MFMSEQVHTGFATSIIEASFDQYTKHSAFAGIHFGLHQLYFGNREHKLIPLPTTAIRVSITSSGVSGACRIMTLPVQLLSFSLRLSISSSPPTLRVIRTRHSACSTAPARRILSKATSHCSFENPIESPLSSWPKSNSVSPLPSSILFCRISPSCCNVTSASSPVSSRRSLSLAWVEVSARLRESSMSSSACSSYCVLWVE